MGRRGHDPGRPPAPVSTLRAVAVVLVTYGLSAGERTTDEKRRPGRHRRRGADTPAPDARQRRHRRRGAPAHARGRRVPAAAWRWLSPPTAGAHSQPAGAHPQPAPAQERHSRRHAARATPDRVRRDTPAPLSALEAAGDKRGPARAAGTPTRHGAGGRQGSGPLRAAAAFVVVVILGLVATAALPWLRSNTGEPRQALTTPTTLPVAPLPAVDIRPPAPAAGGDALATLGSIQPGAITLGAATAPTETGQPTSIAIPAIGLQAPLVVLGLTPAGTLDVPARFDVAGWYGGGPQPGQPGPALIAGHVDSYTGPAVFWHLKDLSPGDDIVVTGPAGTVRFKVDLVTQYAKDQFPTAAVFGPTPERALRLVTCGGTFDRAAHSYRDNVVVYATALSDAGGGS